MEIVSSIQSKIFEIRNQKVMLDFDIAALYQIETKRLKEAVRRNVNRFPEDFMFELSENEWQALRSQIASTKKGGIRYAPFAFTEQGVAMLSSVLNTPKSIEINISIIRAFVLLRQYALTYKELTEKVKKIESKFPDIYKALDYLLTKDKQKTDFEKRKRIGFKTE